MTKEELLQILEVSEKESIPEKEACFKVMGKYVKLSHYKHKYGIEVNQVGKAKFTARVERQMKVNDNYFSEISNENCYYAGFIAADGNINKNEDRLTIGLAGKDSYFLEKFLEKLESDYKVHIGKKDDIYEYSAIYITSKQICSDLYKNFNIYPNKSLTLTPPNLEGEFLDCFIMGLIDGDGTISTTKHKKTQDRFYISMSGTKETVELVQKRFNEILNDTSSNLFQRDSEKNFYSYRIGDKKAREIFCYFYEKYNYLPTLSRKWSKENYDYCTNFKKELPISRRKGVNIFNLKGEFIKTCSTLKEAEEFTGTASSTISRICKEDSNKHQSNGYMFSRTRFDRMEPYNNNTTNIKYYLNKFLDKEGKELDKGEVNIEDEA